MTLSIHHTRKFILVTAASITICLTALQYLSTPFIVIAMPLTLAALYFPFTQTLSIALFTLSISLIAIQTKLISTVNHIYIYDIETISLILISYILFPLFACIAMTNIRSQQLRIRELSERLNLATSSSGLGVWEWNTESGAIYWNDQMFELYGMENRTKIDRGLWQQRINSEDKNKIDVILRATIQGKKVDPVSFGITTPSGEKKIIRATVAQTRGENGRIVKLVGINSDITKDHYTEALLEQKSKMARLAQKEFVLLFEMAPGPLVLINPAGQIQKANGALHSMFGYHNGDLLSRSIQLLFPDSHISEILGWLKNASAIDSPEFQEHRMEIFGKTQDDASLEVEVVQQVIHNNDEAFIIISIRDITQQKIVETEISRARQNAENANLAKSEFIANMSHEIRTPLNATLGTVKLLQNTQLSNMQLGYLQMIQDSGESLLAILNDILDISKIEAGRMDLSPVNFDLEDMLNHTGSIMAVNAADKNLELSIEIPHSLGLSYFGDPLRLQQILINLVSNAIKFTNTGSVQLSVKGLSLEYGHAVLEFLVKDTGIGISKENKSKLFGSFSQADNSITRRYGGTGLGLVISKRLVEIMGGEIDFESEKDIGSTFSFTISLIEASDKPSPPQPELAQGTLIIEQKSNIYNSLKEILTRWKCPFEISTSMTDATQKIRNIGPFSLILLSGDIEESDKLTQGDINKLCKDTPIIVMHKNHSKERVFSHLSREYIDASIQQPITCSGLRQAINISIANKRGIKENDRTDQQESPLHLLGLKLLLVEDNKMNQVVAKGLLEQYGAEVEIAADGLQALTLLKQDPSRCHTVLMDVQMPNMDGFTATTKIRNELNLHLPIIAMSAGVMLSEKNRCTEVGMDDFISKPINVEEMLNTILKCNHKSIIKHDINPSNENDNPNTVIFNPERLLKYVRGNSQRYNSIIQMIRNVVKQGLTPFNEGVSRFKQGDHDTARRIFHTLKGSMGNIGATHVWESAQEIEFTLTKGPPYTDLQDKLNALEESLMEMLQRANLWLDSHHAEFIDTTDEHPHSTTVADTPNNIEERLKQLRTLLSDNNMKAFDSYDSLKNHIKKSLNEDDFERFDSAMQSLDFSNALSTLEAIKSNR